MSRDVMEMITMIEQVRDLARSHENHECNGLPLCASCMAVVLLRNNMDCMKAKMEVDSITPGTRQIL